MKWYERMGRSKINPYGTEPFWWGGVGVHCAQNLIDLSYRPLIYWPRKFDPNLKTTNFRVIFSQTHKETDGKHRDANPPLYRIIKLFTVMCLAWSCAYFRTSDSKVVLDNITTQRIALQAGRTCRCFGESDVCYVVRKLDVLVFTWVSCITLQFHRVASGSCRPSRAVHAQMFRILIMLRWPSLRVADSIFHILMRRILYCAERNF